MYFNESDYLLRDGVGGPDVVEAVDAFLFGRKPANLFSEDVVVTATGQPRLRVRAVMAGYVKENALTVTPMVECPEASCRTWTPVERVEVARAEGDEEPCDGPCSQDLAALTDLQTVNVYKLVAMPVL